MLKKKRCWSHKLRYIFVSCLWEQELSYSYSVLTSLDSCLQSLYCSETFSTYSCTLNFFCFYLSFFYFSASKAAQYFLAIFRNIFIILFMPQATKATPSFSLLPGFYTLYLYCLLLICSWSWFDWLPPVTLWSLLLCHIRCFSFF